MSAGYRACPPQIPHPRIARRITFAELEARNSKKLHDSGPLCSGHLGTEVWYDNRTYVIRVHIEGAPDVIAESICTFTPMAGIGMDRFDGQFAEDLEAWILAEQLGLKTDRLAVFRRRDSVDSRDYLADRGFLDTPNDSTVRSLGGSARKPWWKAW